MNKKRERYEELYGKYRNNELSLEEFGEFIRLLSEDESAEDGWWEDQAREDWQGSADILRKIRAAEQTRNQKIRIRRWIGWSVAAVVLLGVMWVFWPVEEREDLVFRTGFGEVKNIELPDGSLVLLNANSIMKWKGDWNEQERRSVQLEGEAFFDVIHVNEMSFEVFTPDLKVDVKGTRFNVKTRGAETDVFLQSGAVNLEVTGGESKVLELMPGDFVSFDQMSKEVVTSSEHLLQQKASWIDGMLEFQNEKVYRILKDFENLYGKSFKVKNEELLDRRLDLSLPYADWDLIQQALEIALDVQFEISDHTIIVE